MMSEEDRFLTAPLTRRDFVKTSALLGGTAAFAAQVPWLFNETPATVRRGMEPTAENVLSKPENIIYTICQQCNGQCGIKVKLHDGVAVKIDGNPFSPWNARPHLPYDASPLEIATMDAGICPKGQAGIQTMYDPYRVAKVLKRVGPRGSNRWQSISFEKAIDEIVEGGKLFARVRGEEDRVVPGLKEIFALRDASVARKMATDVSLILAAKDQTAKRALVEKFKGEHAADLDKLIDPDHPDLGPKNNQFVLAWGRLKAGRGDLFRRFARDAFGSVNTHGHTTVCQGSLYFAGKAMSEQFVEGKWSGGKKFFWQADQESSEFIIFVGVNPFEASQAMTNRSRRIAENLADGKLKFVVIDPRLSRIAAKAWKWLPNEPGTEVAIALALTRWIIDNKRYDERFLENANKAAATADGEPSWSNATWLVKIDDQGMPGKFLRASEIGLAQPEKRVTSAGSEWELDPFVVLKDGQPVAFDPNDTAKAVEGDLFVNTTLSGIGVKSSLELFREEASTHSIEEWAKIAGVRARDLSEIASEFTSHGKKAVAEAHRGVSQHTNGFYASTAWLCLNLLVGNFDWKGGTNSGSAYDVAGGKTGQPYPLSRMHPGKTSPFGATIIRSEMKYEDTTLFSGYPARRPWYPLASDIYQEIVPSTGDAYPYPVKAMILYMGSPVYASPAGNTNIEILADPDKLPLFIANDITIGETSMYADYIFPDLTYLERWEFSGTHFNIPWKVQGVRQPAAASLNETVKVFGEEMPLSIEALLLAISEKLGLSGFGPDGFGEYGDFKRPEDLYLKMVANVAFGERADGSGGVAEADDQELELLSASRRHLSSAEFDVEKWKAAVRPDLWRRVVYVLNRGGRFEEYEAAYEGERLRNRYGALINLYQEKTATTKDSMTGKYFRGIPHYSQGPTDSLGRLIDDDDGFDMRLITHREASHTKSRTISNYWLLGLDPDGVFIINKQDGKRLGLKSGDKVRVISATNREGIYDLKNGQAKPMVGTIELIEGIRPGVVSFSLGFGHWAYGSRDVVIDGMKVRGDARRGKGIHANAAMRTDPVLTNTCLSDIVGASAVFYDTMVRLVKV
jgi:tetrathionate reductase subunit A